LSDESVSSHSRRDVVGAAAGRDQPVGCATTESDGMVLRASADTPRDGIRHSAYGGCRGQGTSCRPPSSMQVGPLRFVTSSTSVPQGRPEPTRSSRSWMICKDSSGAARWPSTGWIRRDVGITIRSGLARASENSRALSNSKPRTMGRSGAGTGVANRARCPIGSGLRWWHRSARSSPLTSGRSTRCLRFSGVSA